MEQDAVGSALSACTLRPAVRDEVPDSWWALLGATPQERTAVVTSWWPSGVLTGFPQQPEQGTELVDVRPVVDRHGRPQLAYVYGHRTGVLGVLAGGPPAGAAPVDPVVPDPWRIFFAQVHEWFGGVEHGFCLVRPDPGSTLTAHLDHPLLTDQEDWTDPPLDDEGEELPLPRPEDLVVVGWEDGGGWILMLHPDTPPGRAYSWWDEMSLVDLASDTARCISSRIRWDDPPPVPPGTTYTAARARLEALEVRRVEFQPRDGS